MERKALIAFYLFLIFVLAVLVSVAYGNTNAPPSIPSNQVYKVIYQSVYVYDSEIITNTDHTTTWVKYATATNVVEKYAPMIVIDVLSKDELSDEWKKDGRQFVVLLGTNHAKFYSAELSIK